jgi:signal transduction histidine kinase
LRLQLRDLYSKIKQKSVGSSLGDQGSYPLFVLDPDNLVLVWNDAMQELLHIPSQAILYNPFDQLLLNESQQLWDERMAEFRSHTSQPECAPHEVFSLVDNEGNAVHVRVHLGRNEVMGMELITVTVIETLLPAAEKAAAAPVVEPALPEVRNLEPFISDLHKAPCLTPSADLPRLQEQARIMSRNLEHALLTIFGQPAWTTMVEQTTKKQRSGFLSMQQEIERTFALLRRLQYFSQALPLHRRPVLLHTLIRQSSSMQAHLFSQPVYIRLNLDPQVGLVMADVSLLQQAIDFLCQNALEALQSLGDCLIISTRFDVMPGNEEQPAVEIEIMDNGPGLDERVAGKLFEPFVTTKQEERGYGLGLAATYGIINSHQGVLQIRSGKGLGVAVRILLPAYRNADEQAAAESAVFAFRQNRLVLIVDDDPDLIPMMKKALAGAGFRVLTADTGEKALELVKKNRDALAGAIIDLQLWGMSGIECSKKILQLKRIPIIVSSGLPPMAEAMGVVQSCGGFYLEKPYGMSHLVEIARQMF